MRTVFMQNQRNESAHYGAFPLHGFRAAPLESVQARWFSITAEYHLAVDGPKVSCRHMLAPLYSCHIHFIVSLNTFLSGDPLRPDGPCYVSLHLNDFFFFFVPPSTETSALLLLTKLVCSTFFNIKFYKLVCL